MHDLPPPSPGKGDLSAGWSQSQLAFGLFRFDTMTPGSQSAFVYAELLIDPTGDGSLNQPRLNDSYTGVRSCVGVDLTTPPLPRRYVVDDRLDPCSIPSLPATGVGVGEVAAVREPHDP